MIRLITISVAALMPFLLVVVPWHVYMHIQFGWDFWREYLVYHQLARAGTTLEGHSRSPLFYFSYLLDLRSSGILLIVILAAVRVRFDIRAHKILLLALVLLVMLSFLGTKIAWYSLYVIPILVIASAGLFVAVKQTRAKHRIFTFLLFTLISVQILVTLLNLGLHLERFTDNYAEGIEQLYTPEGELNRQIYYEYLTAR